MMSNVVPRLIFLMLLASKVSAQEEVVVPVEQEFNQAAEAAPEKIAKHGYNAGHYYEFDRAVLRKCSDTSISSGFFNSTFFTTTCPPNGNSAIESNICGSDMLHNGKVMIRRFSNGKRNLFVQMTGVARSTLYSIYFLPIGANPCSEKKFVGNLITSDKGKAARGGKLIRDCGPKPWPACLNNRGSLTDAVDPFEEGYLPNAGYLFIYSRGNSKLSNGKWNTVDGPKGYAETPFGVLANPILWGSNEAEQFGGIQYIAAIS